MPPRYASYRGGLLEGGRVRPLPPPGGQGAGAGRWSRPGCIPAGEGGIDLAALNDIQFFSLSPSVSIYCEPWYVT